MRCYGKIYRESLFHQLLYIRACTFEDGETWDLRDCDAPLPSCCRGSEVHINFGNRCGTHVHIHCVKIINIWKTKLATIATEK